MIRKQAVQRAPILIWVLKSVRSAPNARPIRSGLTGELRGKTLCRPSVAVGVRRWIILECPVTARSKSDCAPHIFLNVPFIP